MLFNFGNIVFTRGICKRCEESNTFEFFVNKALQMHTSGDWGDICDEDWENNQKALANGERLFSAYWMDDLHTEKIWIITEADRSATTVLFPDEY